MIKLIIDIDYKGGKSEEEILTLFTTMICYIEGYHVNYSVERPEE